MSRVKAIRLCQSLLDNLTNHISTERNLQVRSEMAQDIWMCCIEELSDHLNRRQELTLLSSLSSELKESSQGPDQSASVRASLSQDQVVLAFE